MRIPLKYSIDFSVSSSNKVKEKSLISSSSIFNLELILESWESLINLKELLYLTFFNDLFLL